MGSDNNLSLKDRLEEIHPGESEVYDEMSEAVYHINNEFPGYKQVLLSDQEEVRAEVLDNAPEEIKIYGQVVESAANYLESITGIQLINRQNEAEDELSRLREITRAEHNIGVKERKDLGSDLRKLKHSSKELVDRFGELVESYDRCRDIDTTNLSPGKSGLVIEEEERYKNTIHSLLDFILFEFDNKLIQDLVGENPAETIIRESLENENSTESEILDTYFEAEDERQTELVEIIKENYFENDQEVPEEFENLL